MTGITMKKGIIATSAIMVIFGLGLSYHFSTILDEIGTYESINLLYMLVSQGICGLGLVGLLIGFGLRAPINGNP